MKPVESKIEDLMGLKGKAPHERFLIQLTGSGKNSGEITALNQELAKYRDEKSKLVIQLVKWRQLWTFPAVSRPSSWSSSSWCSATTGRGGRTEASADGSPSGH